MSFHDQGFPSPLAGLQKNLCGQIIKIRMEFFGNIATYDSHSGVACNFSKLVAAHAICNNIQSKGNTIRATGNGGGKRKQAVFIINNLPTDCPTLQSASFHISRID
jgi:hypothetical protein